MLLFNQSNPAKLEKRKYNDISRFSFVSLICNSDSQIERILIKLKYYIIPNPTYYLIYLFSLLQNNTKNPEIRTIWESVFKIKIKLHNYLEKTFVWVYLHMLSRKDLSVILEQYLSISINLGILSFTSPIYYTYTFSFCFEI